MILKKTTNMLLILGIGFNAAPYTTSADVGDSEAKSILQCGIKNNNSQSRCAIEEKIHDSSSNVELSYNFEIESNCLEVEQDIEIQILGDTRSVSNGRKNYSFVSKESPLIIRSKNSRIFSSRVYPPHCKVLLYKASIHASSNQWANWVEELEMLEKNLNASTLSLALNLDIQQMSSALNLLSRLSNDMARELAREDLLELRNQIPEALKLIEKITDSESSLLSAPEILTLSKIQLILKRVEDDSFWKLENGEPRNLNSLISNNEKEMLESALSKARNFDQQQLLEHLRSFHLTSIQTTKEKIDDIKQSMQKWKTN